jgi:hypothetical protein
MTDSRWLSLLGLLAFGFALVFSVIPRVAAQTDGPALIKPLCNPVPTNTNIASLTADQLTNSLPCAERFDTVADPDLDGPRRRFQQGFNFLSWMTFLALNAPASGDPITKPADPTRDTPAKWEKLVNFRPLANVMRSVDRPPTLAEWGKPDVPELCLPKLTDGMVVLHRIEEAFNQPFKTGPLIDQNGKYAIFDILMNQTMFNYIVEKRLFTKALQAAQPTDFIVDFPSGANASATPPAGFSKDGQIGAVMLKVSWKILDPVTDKDPAGKIHTATALIYTPASEEPKRPATCSDPTKVGLIGFHVGHKTKDRRQWIWTTFEHLQNAPEQRSVDDPKALLPRYFFFDVAHPQGPYNQTPDRPWDPRIEPFPNGFKSQITRTIPVADDTATMNKAFQARLQGTVWANYMLVSTQWPSNFGCSANIVQNSKAKQPDMTCEPVPTFLANSTLETFTQGMTQLSSSSCMSCHNNATSYQRPAAQSDFTFILEKAQ